MSDKKKKKEAAEETEAAAATPETVETTLEETPAAEETSELQAALDEATRKEKEHYDLYLRSRADLENYRKRVTKEKEDLVKFGNERLILEILPVVDNLYLALDHADPEKAASLIEGVKMTLEQFQRVLDKFGVIPVPAAGQMFDPARHEALGQIESDLPPNTVVTELQKGYLLNERLLRPARVMVAKEKSTPASDTPEAGEGANA